MAFNKNHLCQPLEKWLQNETGPAEPRSLLQRDLPQGRCPPWDTSRRAMRAGNGEGAHQGHSAFLTRTSFPSLGGRFPFRDPEWHLKEGTLQGALVASSGLHACSTLPQSRASSLSVLPLVISCQSSFTEPFVGSPKALTQSPSGKELMDDRVALAS